MQKLSISRHELSKTLGVSLSAIAMYFSGYYKIRKVIALAIEAAYGINADWIMHDKQPVFIYQRETKVSNDAMEAALLYKELPANLQAIAKTMVSGLHELPGSTKQK